jgi:outer membrane protein TolC
MTGKPRQAGGQTDGYRQYPSRRRVVVACGCTNPDQIAALSDTRAGFAAVGETARTAIGKETVWIQNAAEAEANAMRVHALTHRKTLSADIAVQVALLNNKGLQAAYADLGLTATELWQQSLQPNPTVSVEVLGIGAPGLGAYRAIEGRIANNILSLLTRDRRVAIADLRFRQAQLRAAEATLRVAGDTRTAWIDAVAAFEAAALIAQAQETANAASELAARLDETGALNKSGQARELGLWGTEVDYFVPDALPRLPNGLVARPQIEAEALSRRVDLQVAKLELEATAKEQDLTEATRTLTDLEIIAGFEAEREIEDGDRKTETTPQVEVEFDIPIFDSGKARKRRAETTYMRAANELAQMAVNVRSEARSAYLSYTGSHQIARHFRDAVLPLRRSVEEKALLSYNGMITNTFGLLADTRARLGSDLMEASARRDFWLADANLVAAIYGGGVATSVGGGTALAAGDPPH